MGENDKSTSLLERIIQHAKTTADFAVYYGEGRDFYDVWGRTAHESIFNLNDGNYRWGCLHPSSCSQRYQCLAIVWQIIPKQTKLSGTKVRCGNPDNQRKTLLPLTITGF
jgi:hypothetical protein